ncbi:MAG TPA: pilus assembly protein TadG-related protein, partial [Candidatus Limnocylindrales bacterium]|nr:pilus assembly protein TadG-related protein [Candidatus Limnocylindrales bacterium]
VVAALAYDVGMMLVERRDEQNAADAAALAGARYLVSDDPVAEAAAIAAARDIALVNGFDDADPDEIVNVYIPPIHGQYAGLPRFIEVQIEGTRPSIFGGIVGRATWPVGVMAVATNEQNLTFPFSMLSLDPTACKAIQVTGGGVVEAFGSIQANSSGADCSGPPIGFSRTGGSTINVFADDSTCRAVGAIQDQGSGSMTCDKDDNSFALPDPLRDLDAPAEPGLAPAMVYAGSGTAPSMPPKNCPGRTDADAPDRDNPQTCVLGNPSSTYAGLQWILYPGLYPGGLEVNNGTTAYLMPGIYWLGGGGFRTTTDGSVITIATEADANPDPLLATWGGGVMIFNSELPNMAGGPISLGGSSATLKLKDYEVLDTDPTFIYNNIVIFQDRALTETVTLNGSSSNSEVEGVIYVPNGEVKLNGNGGTLTVDQIIAGTFLIDGNGGTIEVLRRVGFDAVIVAAGLVE